jgi:hypothetical protein
MWCPACAWLIETALSRTPGFLSAAQLCHRPAAGSVRPVTADPNRITAVIERFGYSRPAGRKRGSRPAATGVDLFRNLRSCP